MVGGDIFLKFGNKIFNLASVEVVELDHRAADGVEVVRLALKSRAVDARYGVFELRDGLAAQARQFFNEMGSFVGVVDVAQALRERLRLASMAAQATREAREAVGLGPLSDSTIPLGAGMGTGMES